MHDNIIIIHKLDRHTLTYTVESLYSDPLKCGHLAIKDSLSGTL